MQWLKNPTVENFLDQHGIPYHYEAALPFSSINLEKGLRNNARLSGPIDQDTAIRYGIRMDEGFPFLSGVVVRNGKGYLPIDYNHRLQGFKLSRHANKDATVGAYVLDTDDAILIETATRSLNSTNGLQQSKTESVEQALALLDKFPAMTQAQAAKVFGVSVAVISEAVRARQVASVLRERRINAESLSRAALIEVGRLSHSEPAMALAADIAIANKLTANEVKDLVRVAKDKTSDDMRVRAIREAETAMQRSAPKSIERKSNVKANFLRSLHTLFGIASKHPSAEHLHITSKSEKDQLQEDWRQLCAVMEKIIA